MITQEQVKELLHYIPESIGSFLKGCIAGSLDVKGGYVRISVLGVSYKAHRLAWFYVHGAWPNQIDHINGIRDDNRLINLRSVTAKENQQNKQMQKNNKSGVCGVRWAGKLNKWRCTINDSGAAVNLGVYHDFFEAICARKSAENRYGFHPNHGRKAND